MLLHVAIQQIKLAAEFCNVCVCVCVSSGLAVNKKGRAGGGIKEGSSAGPWAPGLTQRCVRMEEQRSTSGAFEEHNGPCE